MVTNCMGIDDCIICAGDAAQQGVNLTELARCESLGSSCATYFSIPEGVDNPDEYEIQGTIGSSIECMISSDMCQYTYFQGISVSTGQPVYEVVPPSCLLIQWWAIPIIIIFGLFLLEVVIVVAGQIILRWLEYQELKHLLEKVQVMNINKKASPVNQACTVTLDDPIYEN